MSDVIEKLAERQVVAIEQIAKDLHKMANPPMVAVSFGDLEGLLFGGCCSTAPKQATPGQQAKPLNVSMSPKAVLEGKLDDAQPDLREELYYLLARAYNMGTCARFFTPGQVRRDVDRKDLYHLAAEAAGVVKAVVLK